MSHHKRKHVHPVPPGNQPQSGPPVTPAEGQQGQPGGGAPFQEQDVKRRLGGFEGAGEHSIQQPSALNDGTQRSQ